MLPQEIIQRCDALETALRDYQSVIETMIYNPQFRVEAGKRLGVVFSIVRDAYIDLEPLLTEKKLQVTDAKSTRNWGLWPDIPTFRDIRSSKDFDSTFGGLELLLMEMDSGANPVHQELVKYYDYLDVVRRAAVRKIRDEGASRISDDHPQEAKREFENPEIDSGTLSPSIQTGYPSKPTRGLGIKTLRIPRESWLLLTFREAGGVSQNLAHLIS